MELQQWKQLEKLCFTSLQGIESESKQGGYDSYTASTLLLPRRPSLPRSQSCMRAARGHTPPLLYQWVSESARLVYG